MIRSAILPRLVRRTARWMGIGRALLKFHSLRAVTLRGAATMFRARSRDLPRIFNAAPIPAGDGSVELHMLLHHGRIIEGIWALYSFAYFAGIPVQMVVHSDGSLTATDAGRLQQVLPGTHVISRRVADELVEQRLTKLGLSQSVGFRKSLIFALKLFDPFFFGQQPNFFLLDSDVLFFRRPHELLDDLIQPISLEPPNLYSSDNGVRYCLPHDTLVQLLGQECIDFFNPGIVRVNRSVLDLERIEAYLHHQEFWGSGSRPHYYAELTLWAMLLTLRGARRLPPTYAITPPLTGEPPTSGHFCGGGFPATWFYSRGVPYLAKLFGV